MAGLLSKIREFFGVKILAAELKNDPLQLELVKFVNDEWHSNPQVNFLSDSAASAHFEDMFQVVADVREQSSVLPLRNYIFTVVKDYSESAVLCINEAEKHSYPGSNANLVSWELNKYLSEEGAHLLTDTLESMAFNLPNSSNEERIGACRLKTELAKFHLGASEIMRAFFDDKNTINPNKDWVKPFLEVSMEQAEYNHRKKLHLSQLSKNFNNFRHIVFMKYVLEAREPLLEFEKSLTKLDDEY
jgi:hypothetical protein